MDDLLNTTPPLNDNAIIQITTHGAIILNDNNTIPPGTVAVPNNMSIVYMSAVAPGACNLIDYDTLQIINTSILQKVDDINGQLNLLTPDATEDTLNQIKKYFVDTMSTLKIQDKSSNYNRLSKLFKKNTIHPDDIEYMYNFAKFYRVSIYKGGQQIRNKLFARTDRDAVSKIGQIYDLDLKINMLTEKYGNGDLMNILDNHIPDINTPDHYASVTLEQLLGLLSNLNIKNAVIFDFTCAGFIRGDENIEESREVRRERREVLKQELKTNPPQNTRRKRKVSSLLESVGGKRFTRKNRKNRKFKKSRKSKYRKSRKRFRTMNKQK
jgi:hypothetical protein